MGGRYMGVVFGAYEGTVGEGSGSVSEGDVDGVDRGNTGWEGPGGERWALFCLRGGVPSARRDDNATDWEREL